MKRKPKYIGETLAQDSWYMQQVIHVACSTLVTAA